MNHKKTELIVSICLIVIILIILVVDENKNMESFFYSTIASCPKKSKTDLDIFEESFKKTKTTAKASLIRKFNDKQLKFVL